MNRLLRKFKRVLYPTNTIVLRRLESHLWYDTDTRMFEAMFELLCEYVENELAFAASYNESTRWERFKLYWLPRQYRYEISRKFAMKYLEWEMQVDGGEGDQAISAQKVKELYEWYRDIYPFIKNPYESAQDPEYMFLDVNGNPTNEAFVKDDNGKYYKMNKFHPEYSRLLNQMNDDEVQLNEMIDEKLRILLSIRRYLWT